MPMAIHHKSNPAWHMPIREATSPPFIQVVGICEIHRIGIPIPSSTASGTARRKQNGSRKATNHKTTKSQNGIMCLFMRPNNVVDH